MPIGGPRQAPWGPPVVLNWLFLALGGPYGGALLISIFQFFVYFLLLHFILFIS